MINELIDSLNDNELLAVRDALKGTKHTQIIMRDPSPSALISACARAPFVYICASAEDAISAGKTLECCGIKPIVVTTVPDMPIYTDMVGARDQELSSAVLKFESGVADCLVIPCACLLARVPSVNVRNKTISVGERVQVKQCADLLRDFGYEKVQTVTQVAEYSVRGDIIDMWQEHEAQPHRIMFFGNSVEAIKVFDTNTYLSIGKQDSVTITAINEVANVTAQMVLAKLKESGSDLKVSPRILDDIISRAQLGEGANASRWILPFFTEFDDLFARFGRARSIVLSRPREIMQILRNAEEQNGLRLASLIEGGALLPIHKQMFTTVSAVIRDFVVDKKKPGSAPKKQGEIEKKYISKGKDEGETEKQYISISTTKDNGELFVPKTILNLRTVSVANYFSNLSALVPDIVRAVEVMGKTAVVFVGATKACENYMTAKHITFVKSTPSTIKKNVINLVNTELNISCEFESSKTVFFSLSSPHDTKHEQNVFERNMGKFTIPAIGEVVVHEVHGLGRYLGIKKLALKDAERDYIVLQYDGGALVYMPTEQTQALSNYSGEPARLSKIGGQDFANAKQRVRRRLKELSFKLTELYNKRGRARANTYDCADSVMLEYASSFPYILTADQVKAIEDIDRDMGVISSSINRSAQNNAPRRVMDRLICGDVGYGKTEVALRAAFRAIMSGYQVALLCPTTILSVQHTKTARERLQRFGIKVEVLNRFRTDSEVRDVLAGVANGTVDLIIGTHRLLSSDVVYKNLGLLILDEEQRFGVAHKERIKLLRTNIDVIALSATPIPRTLNMALIGIRDISVIATPPRGRLPVITYVCAYSESLVKDAINRELSRGGQVLMLYNDVATINGFASRIVRLCPSARVGIIHGQLSEHVLEETILALYLGKIDVVVASTIIENGIDIATANTLISINSERLGVAQMHQLRGRVGRGLTQAYAYFMYSGGIISDIARDRLDAIVKHTTSGAGFKIAQEDLKLRGAGNILGASQSGHMEQIGFDTYCKILAEVSAENRGEELPKQDELPEPVLDIAVHSFLPHTYIESETERIKIYNAISGITSREDRDRTFEHLEDLYGRAPNEVRNIVDIGYVRALCKMLGVRHLAFSHGSATITFFDSARSRKMFEVNDIEELIRVLEQM